MFHLKNDVMKGKIYFVAIMIAFLSLPFISKGQGANTDIIYLKNGSVIHGMIIEQIPGQSIKVQSGENNIFVYKLEEIDKISKDPAVPSTREDVIHLKNGSVIHGTIVDQVPNQPIKIQTKDNNVFVYQIAEIDKITKEQPAASAKSGSGKGSKYVNKGFSLGVKAGLDISRVSNEDLPSGIEKVSKLGFQGGFVGNLGFGKFLSVQMELLFAQKGLEISETASGVTVKAWETVNYLEIPLLAKFSLPAGPVVIYANVGPSFGIGLFGKFGSKPDMGIDQKVTFDEGGLKRFDFGLLFGAGAGIKVGKGLIYLDLRYGLGISDINNVTDAEKMLMVTKRTATVTSGLLSVT